MASCAVLRCPNASAGVFVLTRPPYPKMSVPVCLDHRLRLDSDEPFHYDEQQQVLLMGDDLMSDEGRLITGVHSISNVGVPGGRRKLVTFTCEDGGTRSLLITEAALRELGTRWDASGHDPQE